MRSLNSGARKKPWRIGSSQPSWKRPHAFVLSFSFSFCCGSFFEDRSVRNGYCLAWLQRTRASSCHQDVAWCWSVDSTRALSERSGLCKAPNETKKRQKRWESGKRQQLKPVLSWQHVQAHLTSNARATQNLFKVGEVANTAIQAAALQRRFGRTGRCAVRFDEV